MDRQSLMMIIIAGMVILMGIFMAVKKSASYTSEEESSVYHLRTRENL